MTSVVAPLVNTTYTANFTTQYYLTMQANPGGSVTPQSGWYNRAQQVTITAIPDAKYRFTTWSGTGTGSYSGSSNPATVTINSPIRQIANFTRNPVLITIGTEPDGRSFIYDGFTYTSLQTRSVEPGSQHTISVQSPQPDINPDKQYIWWYWSDGGAQTHNIYPMTDSNFTAFFKTQYAITINTTNSTAGSVEPSGRKFYTEGDTLQITARANKGYIFTGWSGSINSTNNPINIIVDSSKTIYANFAEAAEITFKTQPESLNILINNTNYRTPVKINFLKGSSHNLSTISPQYDSTGKIKYEWNSWSDSGDISHNITFTKDSTIIANFLTYYYLMVVANQGGEVDIQSGWQLKDTTITLTAIPDSGYLFNEWIGTGEGSYSGNNNPTTVLMKSPITQIANFSKILPPPILTGIPDRASDIPTNPNLRWQSYPGATYYILQVSTDSTFSDTGKLIISLQTTDTTYQLNNLVNLITYFWRVRAKVGNDITTFSAIRRFTTINATIVVQTPLMNWASGYKYQINWTSNNLSGKVNIVLYTDSMQKRIILKDNYDNNGMFNYVVHDSILQGKLKVDYCKIRIESYLNNIVYGESGNFSIVSGTLPQSVRLSTQIQFPQEALSSTYYRLVSLPGIVDTIKIGNFISGKQKFDWRIFSDNGNPDNFLEELSTSASLKTGQGYWFIKNGNLTITDFEMRMPKLDSTATFTINLNPGWNIIANPFDKTITWASILHSNNLQFSTILYAYDGSYKSTLTLEPFRGYYFFNTNNLAKLKIPYPFGWLGQQKVTEDIVWQLQLIYETNGIIDSNNYLGVAKHTSFDIDNYDQHKPPMFKDQAYLYFEQKDINSKYNKFATDFRPDLGEGQKWQFMITNPQKQISRLIFNNIEQLPNEYEIFLVNPNRTKPINLRQTNEFIFDPTSDINKFELIVGTVSFIQRELQKLIPEKFELSQNYPNPFNSTTTIHLKLPESGYVEMDIYNSIGQKIITLIQKQLEAGSYTYNWNGTDNNKNAVSSGIYFYRVKIDGIVKDTKKMIIIK
ncbi:MAG: hypothetical protein IGBAC_0324 [Ignavibacteriae bacterium]|nr:MAG: hypothetical protein IGBAC_0324 [Ignavibacteriota bacterium]